VVLRSGLRFGGAGPFGPVFFAVSKKGSSPGLDRTMASLVYTTTQSSSSYGERPATRTRRLAEAIYGQPEVLDVLREHPASGTAGIVTVKALRKEIKALEEAGDMFGAYRSDCR
jgi:hypothetical protein